MDYNIVEPKIGSFYYMMPNIVQGTIVIPTEFYQAVAANGGTVQGISGEALTLARKGIFNMNGNLWQFYSDSSAYDYTKPNCSYAGIYMCCGTVYSTITDEMYKSPIANNINEYIWENGDIKTEYKPGETEETAEVKIGEVYVDEDYPKRRLVNTDFMPNTILIYCQSYDVTGSNTIIDKIVFYNAANRKKVDYVFNVGAPGISIYKVGCVAKMVLRDGDSAYFDVEPNVAKTSTDMEYLNGVISESSRAKTKLAPKEGGYIYTANGTYEDETFIPSSMMTIGDVVDLENEHEMIGAKHLISACTEGDIYYISGRGFEYAALYTLMDNTNKIIDISQGNIDETTGVVKEFTLEIPEGVTKLLYNSISSGNIYKNQTLADVAQQAITRGVAQEEDEEELKKLKKDFKDHKENKLDEARHITTEEYEDIIEHLEDSDSHVTEEFKESVGDHLNDDIIHITQEERDELFPPEQQGGGE